jgi:hypothetical protein
MPFTAPSTGVQMTYLDAVMWRPAAMSRHDNPLYGWTVERAHIKTIGQNLLPGSPGTCESYVRRSLGEGVDHE